MMKRGILFVLIAVFLVPCQQEENEGVASVDRVTTTPIITRAMEVNFEDQDQIGLSVTKEDGTVYATNELMTFNDGAFAGSLKWYPEGVDKPSFVVYYPYSAAGVPISFTVYADQTTSYGISDFMTASKSDVLPSVNSISMTFKHILTELVISVTNKTNLDISSIVFKGFVSTANTNLATMKTTANESAAAADIATQQVTKNKTSRAIVVPQTAAFTLAVTTSDNNTLMQKLVSTDSVQGGQYSVNTRVLPDNIIATLSGEIENWTDEGEIKGDGPGVPFEERDGYLIYDSITYNTVTLSNGTTWMVEPSRYIPDGYTLSSDPATDFHIWYPYELVTADGTPTAKVLQDEASIKQYGYPYDTHAVLSGKAAIPENCYDSEGAQGICPKGWHIPTRAEYFSPVGNPTKDVDGNSLENGKDAFFYDTAYDSGKIPAFNEVKFNYQFSGVRMPAGYSAAPKYQAVAITSSNSTVTEWFGKPSMSCYMTSTAYKPIYSASTGDLTNIQFLELMSILSMAKYPESRSSLSYISALSGQTVCCVKNQN